VHTSLSSLKDRENEKSEGWGSEGGSFRWRQGLAADLIRSDKISMQESVPELVIVTAFLLPPTKPLISAEPDELIGGSKRAVAVISSSSLLRRFFLLVPLTDISALAANLPRLSADCEILIGLSGFVFGCVRR
jgi:hypothetical protein